jgi:ectoine hydroxylase-related dioxygenase (phytanoyl-CoA dioxygenase family)
LAHPLAVQLLELLLGEDFYCKFVSSDTSLRGAVLQSPHRELDAGRTWEPCSYVVNLPLVACGLQNGPLEVWPGAGHHWNQALLDRLKLDTDVQDDRNPQAEWFATLFPSRRVELVPGDLLIRDGGLLHRGTVNHTDEPRTLLTVCYFRRGRTFDYGRWEYNLDPTLWEQLSPEVQRRFVITSASSETATPTAAVEPGPQSSLTLWQRLRRSLPLRKSA